MFAAYLAQVIGISLAVYRFFERPAQQGIRDFAAWLGSPRAVVAKSYS
jgi:peptidoglycan/LPS O-acetylase OafA/YrhL